MRRLLCVSVVLLLAAGSLSAPASAQETRPGSRPNIQLKPNYPNPFNPTTVIPFWLPEEWFESGRPVVVSIKIYDSLMRLVATPSALNHPSGNAALVDKLVYTSAGLHEAFWDGTNAAGRKVPSGVYIARLEVNGERAAPRKLVVAN